MKENKKPDKEFEVAEEFKKSKLGGKSMLFTNDVGMFLVRNKNNNYDAICEAISWIGDAGGCLPENSQIDLSGLQLVLKTKDNLDNNTIQRLENFGYMFQSAHQSIDCDNKEVWYSTFFLQNPDYWDETFEEFLKTYPAFLNKKYKDRLSTKRKLLDFIEDVKWNHKQFMKKWTRSEK